MLRKTVLCGIRQAFDYFPKCHTKILIDYIAKVGRENIFKPIVGNESLHQDINDNGVRIVKFAHQKSSYEHDDVRAPQHS
jgi:hypothetical protein